MQNNSQNFSMQDLMRIAQSPAGRQLISLLQQGDPRELDKITHLASTGNLSQAKDMLQQILNTDKAKDLMQQLGENNG